MMKRITAIVLCLILLATTLSGCSGGSKSSDDKGAYIAMYLTDEIYDFDPASAYFNTDAINVLGLLYEPLFHLSEKGKITNGLAESYKVFTDDDGVHMEIRLKNAVWSNNYALTADDCVFAWRRLLDPSNNFAAASLLFDIKNARAYNQGILTKDDLKVEAVEQQVIRITFEGNVDVNAFLVNLTNVATSPLLKNAISNNADWAKKASTLVTSGPFKVGRIKYDVSKNEKGSSMYAPDDYALDVNGNQILNAQGTPDNTNKVQKILFFYLERNSYYYRDPERDDAIDKAVTPFRILVDCTKTEEELLQDYKDGHIFYMGSIPMSLRNDEFVKSNVKISDAPATTVIYLNENADFDGVKLFADEHVRKALSLAINREALAEAVVYAKAATALVPSVIFEKGTSGNFRKTGGDLLATDADLAAAKAELAKSGLNPANFEFSLNVAWYNDAHQVLAEKIVEAWNELGFKASVNVMYTIQNNDERVESDQVSVPVDVCDDLYTESLQRCTYQAAILDLNAYTANAYSMLSSFAINFSGSASMDENTEYTPNPHITGYASADYNALMEAVYFIPYFSGMSNDPAEALFEIADTNPYLGFGFENKEEYMATYNSVKAVYEKYGIEPTEKSSKWEEQKALLLHEAEKLLMEDLPAIPVVFNQYATMQAKDLSGVTKTFYTPAYFRKTKLKNYKKYTYVFYKFPTVNWDNYGLEEEPE